MLFNIILLNTMNKLIQPINDIFGEITIDDIEKNQNKNEKRKQKRR